MQNIRRIREEKQVYAYGNVGHFFSPTGHAIIRRSFETDGWMLTRKNNGSFRLVNDPLHIFIGLVEGQECPERVVIGGTQGSATGGTR